MAELGASPAFPRRIDNRPTSGVPDAVAAARIELRQLRYFISLAEELHFGRAAAREHIVQSALSQQVQRLERTLGVVLVHRTTRHIELTAAGSRFLLEARQIIEHVDRAAGLAQGLTSAPPALRVGLLDEGYEAARPVLRTLRARYPELEVHQVQVGVPEQCRMLADGRLDVGIGRSCAAPPQIASELFRLDPLGVLVPDGHRLARLPVVPVSALAGETLLMPDESRAPELAEFVAEICRTAGFVPAAFCGSALNLRAAVDLVVGGCCVMCAPASTADLAAPARWRPLAPVVPRYPWSVLWRAEQPARAVLALVAIARELSRREGWRDPRESRVNLAS
ncbi:DNA-binding transcriptional LysR family regulator [Asanoa ferruginea]|uniref:DNA-binding transcriptional LysR family regulator n=1 Tax=Asanoa ferruginea TaxID=53367 RepID=A0A3E0A1R7_9ACTN|nr:LysR substrate-binding domain-containing protein [Asanoa ferruginea]REG00211.1 DNA-binding transcriptional LysR family regulator [Asanoa ferruginea]GIF46090.1 LysR family transcriptional regulator [Asanoa ferruginea]